VPEEANLLDETRMQQLFETYRPDGVIHLAANAGVPQAEASDAAAQQYFDVNVKGTDVVTKLCKDFGVTFLANAGSSSEFGSQAWSEHRLVPQAESSPLVPEGHYGRTKVFSEMLMTARALGNASADHTLVTTFFNPVGVGERGLLVPLMTRKLLECAVKQEGQFTVFDHYRGYTPIDQTLEHLLRGVERMIDLGPDAARLDYQHCGGGITTNNKDIANMTVQALKQLCVDLSIFDGVDFNRFLVFDDDGSRDGDVKATYSDKTKAEQDLLLRPDKDDLADAVVSTVREVATDWLAKQNLLPESSGSADFLAPGFDKETKEFFLARGTA
jgi:nucleoside-diphosphate-sugar epimerase